MPEETKPRLKLYHATPSRSSMAMWMLEEVGEPYEIKLLSLKNGDQHKPEYLAVNPMGKVPAIDDNGTIVSEVSAICCYLADAYPKAGLAPAVTDKLRGPYLKWLFYAPSCIEPAIIDKAMNRPPAPRSTAGWADYDTVIAVLRDAAGKASPYLLGERFTAADVVIGVEPSLGHAVQAAPRAARVRRLHAAPQATPSVAAANRSRRGVCTTDEQLKDIPLERAPLCGIVVGSNHSAFDGDAARRRLPLTASVDDHRAALLGAVGRRCGAAGRDRNERLLEDHRHADSGERLPVRADPARRAAL